MGNGVGNMEPDKLCNGCGVEFGIIKRRRVCSKCHSGYCKTCSGKGTLEGAERKCYKCLLLDSNDLTRSQLVSLKVRDLRRFLERKRVALSHCKEKTDLVNLILERYGGPRYREAVQAQKQREEALRPAVATPAVTAPAQHFNQSSQDASAPLAGQHSTTGQQSTAGQPSTASGATATAASAAQSSTIPPPTTAPPTDAAAPSPAASRLPTHPPPSYQPHQNGGSGDEDENFIDTAEPIDHITLANGDTVPVRASPEQADQSTDRQTDQQTDQPATSAEDQGEGRRKVIRITDVHSEFQIESLSVRNLKQLLVTHYVEYKGCKEKSELIELVKRLWTATRRDQQSLEAIQSEDGSGQGQADPDNICKICMDAIIDCVLLNCGHIVVCTGCGKRLNECPLCRQYVVRVVRTFKS